MNAKIQTFLINTLSALGFASLLVFIYHGMFIALDLMYRVVSTIMESVVLIASYPII